MLQTESLSENLFFHKLIENISPVNFLAQVLTNSQISIVITDTSSTMKVLYSNKAFCKKVNYKLEELVGSSLGLVFGPKSSRRKKTLKTINMELNQKGSFFGATMCYPGKGNLFPAEWLASEIRNPEGNVICYFFVLINLHRQEKAALQIQQSKDVFKRYLSMNHIQSKNQSDSSVQSSKDILFENNPLQTNLTDSVNDGHDDNIADDDDFDFFDISGSSECVNLVESNTREPINAKDFNEEFEFEEEDVAEMIESVDEITIELEVIKSKPEIEVLAFRNISNSLRSLSTSLYFCQDFSDVALSLNNLAFVIDNTQDLDLINIEMLDTIIVELQQWLQGVFIEQTVDNVFDGMTNITALSNQMTMMSS